jgi:enolase
MKGSNKLTMQKCIDTYGIAKFQELLRAGIKEAREGFLIENKGLNKKELKDNHDKMAEIERHYKSIEDATSAMMSFAEVAGPVRKEKKQRPMGQRAIKEYASTLRSEIRDAIDNHSEKIANDKSTFQFSKADHVMLERFVTLGKELNKKFNKLSDSRNFGEFLMDTATSSRNPIKYVEEGIRAEIANKISGPYPSSDELANLLAEEAMKPGFDLAKWTEKQKAKWIKA